MALPTVHGVIERRILVNYRVAPAAIEPLLPQPLRPQLVRGYGVAGVCLIRLIEIRPGFAPRCCGLSSENAAHRIAVEWDDDGAPRCGVYVPRRDTSSWINAALGGRVFPGVHHRARFLVSESGGKHRVEMHSVDDAARVVVEGSETERTPSDSIFSSVDEAAAFFQAGSVGYSPTARGRSLEGLELRSFDSNLVPLAITRCESSYFDGHALAGGAATFDSAFLMRNIRHEWHARAPLACCEVTFAA